jgi:hypothetical protein
VGMLGIHVPTTTSTQTSTMPAVSPPLMPLFYLPSPPHVRVGRSSMSDARVCA